MREMRMSGSMSGMWKRSTDWLMRHRQTKGPETDRPVLNHRVTSRLYPYLMGPPFASEAATPNILSGAVSARQERGLG